MSEDHLLWLCILVGYLYVDSWATTFRLRGIYRRLEKLENHEK